MLILIVLVSSFFYTTIKCAASSSAMPSVQTGSAERGFIRSQDGSIRVVTYDPSDKDAVAKLIDADLPQQVNLLVGEQRLVRKRLCRCPKDNPTKDLYFDRNDILISKQSTDNTPLIYAEQPCEETDILYSNGNPLALETIKGTFLKLICQSSGLYLSRLDDTKYFFASRVIPGSVVKTQFPFKQGDCADVSLSASWIITREGGKHIHLYRCRNSRRCFIGDFANMNEDWQEAPTLSLQRDSNESSDGIFESCIQPHVALKLYQHPDENPEPLVFSSAFSEHDESLLAIVFPQRVVLWALETYFLMFGSSARPTASAKTKTIAYANLAQDKPLDELFCFNEAVFSCGSYPHVSLYFVGNNFVWRYNLKDDKLDRFRFSTVKGLSGSRSIRTTNLGERLAVADPRAGVAIFATKTMSLLCTLQSSLIKHIALGTLSNPWQDGTNEHSQPTTRLAISQSLDDGRTQESVWELVPQEADTPRRHMSLQEYCLTVLGLPQ